jgi:hypothetical protein
VRDYSVVPIDLPHAVHEVGALVCQEAGIRRPGVNLPVEKNRALSRETQQRWGGHEYCSAVFMPHDFRTVAFSIFRNPDDILKHHLWTLPQDDRTAEPRTRMVPAGRQPPVHYNGHPFYEAKSCPMTATSATWPTRRKWNGVRKQPDGTWLFVFDNPDPPA